MAISRRDVLLGSAGALGAATFSFPKPAIAQSEPIKIGCLAAMTGPSSAPTIGFNRGVHASRWMPSTPPAASRAARSRSSFATPRAIRPRR